jgi:hypothetical protein
VTVDGDFTQCRVFSTDGALVMEVPATNGRKTIDLAGLGSGLYLVQMTDRHGSARTERVVVMR